MRPPAASLAGVLGALALTLALLPGPAESAAAGGAVLKTDYSCYLQSRSVRLHGTGFTPGAQYTVSLDGRALGPGTVAADGTLSGTLASGTLAGNATQAARTLTVSDSVNQASAVFAVTAFSAGFSPSTGDPRTLLVRYSVFGFAPGAADPQPLYLHYRSPTGRGGQTIRLGSTHTPCGTVSRTRLRHLFPFRPRAGTWLLQFDTSERYSPSSSPRVVRSVVIR